MSVGWPWRCGDGAEGGVWLGGSIRSKRPFVTCRNNAALLGAVAEAVAQHARTAVVAGLQTAALTDIRSDWRRSWTGCGVCSTSAWAAAPCGQASSLASAMQFCRVPECGHHLGDLRATDSEACTVPGLLTPGRRQQKIVGLVRPLRPGQSCLQFGVMRLQRRNPRRSLLQLSQQRQQRQDPRFFFRGGQYGRSMRRSCTP